jgi:hypothetical protein
MQLLSSRSVASGLVFCSRPVHPRLALISKGCSQYISLLKLLTNQDVLRNAPLKALGRLYSRKAFLQRPVLLLRLTLRNQESASRKAFCSHPVHPRLALISKGCNQYISLLKILTNQDVIYNDTLPTQLGTITNSSKTSKGQTILNEANAPLLLLLRLTLMNQENASRKAF